MLVGRIWDQQSVLVLFWRLSLWNIEYCLFLTLFVFFSFSRCQPTIFNKTWHTILRCLRNGFRNQTWQNVGWDRWARPFLCKGLMVCRAHFCFSGCTLLVSNGMPPRCMRGWTKATWHHVNSIMGQTLMLETHQTGCAPVRRSTSGVMERFVPKKLIWTIPCGLTFFLTPVFTL